MVVYEDNLIRMTFQIEKVGDLPIFGAFFGCSYTKNALKIQV